MLNLVKRAAALRRWKLVQRVGCWLVCLSLVIAMMMPQQHAEALVTELTVGAVVAVTAAYLTSCGLPFYAQGQDRASLQSHLQQLIQDFLDSQMGGISMSEWLSTAWDVSIRTGQLILSRSLVAKLNILVQWLMDTKGISAGSSVTIQREDHITLADGSIIYLSKILDTDGRSDGWWTSSSYSLGTRISIPSTASKSNPYVLTFPKGYNLTFYYDGSSLQYNSFDSQTYFSNYGTPYDQASFYFALTPAGHVALAQLYYSTTYQCFRLGYNNTSRMIRSYFFPTISASGSSLAINAASAINTVDTSSLDSDHAIALDVGAAATMDEDMVLVSDDILDQVVANTLTATSSVVLINDDTAVVAGDATRTGDVADSATATDSLTMADVEGLDLPALGAALTSRFPFSIPWDVYRAVKLLAAPAAVPHFEVDFLAPIADRVGGWRGSTTITLDFADYEILGQLCRWTSTIGFCLVLASGTKRLIWTA